MRVSQIMSSPAVTVDPDASIHDAVGTMLEHGVGSVVVVDSGPAGILTRTDVLRGAYRTGRPLAEQDVRDEMSRDLVTTSATTAVERALDTMEDHGIKRLPVLEELDLVGIVTMTDVARHQPEQVHEVRDVLSRKKEWTD